MKPLHTWGQRQRLARDTAIWLAHRGGMSGRQLSLAFVLSRTRIRIILEEMAAVAADRSYLRPGSSPQLKIDEPLLP